METILLLLGLILIVIIILAIFSGIGIMKDEYWKDD